LTQVYPKVAREAIN